MELVVVDGVQGVLMNPVPEAEEVDEAPEIDEVELELGEVVVTAGARVA